MTSFIANELGRTVIIHLAKGDLFLESVQKVMEEHGIRDAILTSAIGSLRKARMHMILSTDDTANNEYWTIEKPIEMCAVQGLVLDGVCHFHMVTSTPDNDNFDGHVEEGCEVLYMMEVSLIEVKGLNLTRRKDEFDIDYITTL